MIIMSRFFNFLHMLTGLPEEFIRFLCVGAVNTAFAYGLYAGFIFIGFHYALAVFFSTAIGILFSFKTLGKWVFFNTDNRRLWRFFAVYAGGYLLNVGILRLLTLIGLKNLYFAGLISSFAVALASFFLNKYMVFTQK